MTRTRCAIYTRKSSEEGLDQDFNSLDAQYEACSAFIASQRHEGWVLVRERYDDGGISGGHLDRPALQRLMADVEASRVDRIVVYKIDRLTRSLTDFAKLVERLDGAGASFVSVTQAFNTATSMGRLTLNVLLSFAQFEREVTAERIRDKIAASKAKGLWMGGNVPLGYEADHRTLRIVPDEAETVRALFDLYESLGTVSAVTAEAARRGLRSKRRVSGSGNPSGGSIMRRGQIHHVLSNPVYAGRIRHKTQVYEGQHDAIIDPDRWEAIQTRLKDGSAKPRGQQAAAHPSPLAGRLFDETGDRLTPTHARKGGRRYRYYVSRRLVAGAEERDARTGWRLPAERLERDLCRAVQTHLVDCIDRGAITTNDVNAIAHLREKIDALGDRCLGLIETVRLGDGALYIALEVNAIATVLSIPEDSVSSTASRLKLPFTCRRRGIEARLVIGTSRGERDDILIANVVRAEGWRRALLRGEDLGTIAARDGITVKYLGEMLPFAFLSPKLVRAILAGKQPAALTTNWIRRHGVPASWPEQDAILAQL
jgi:site-specific DNA recombinase